MKRFLSLILALATVFGCLTVLSSCGEDGDEGARFDIYLGDEIYDFDPGDYYVSKNAEQVMSLLYEPLFKLTEGGRLKLAAAKSYDVDKETRTITIELRETYWSNGVQVQAQDYEFAWKRIIDPENSNPAAALFADIEGAVDVKTNDESGGIYGEELGISAPKVNELKIVYREGADYKQLLKNLASVAASPINRSAYESDPAGWSKSLSGMLFNGPFVVASIDYEDGSFRLDRNISYHQNPAEAKAQRFVKPHVLFADFNKSFTYDDIKNKVVFFMSDASLEDRAEYKKKADVADALSTYTYVFNTTNAFLSNATVRKALTIAIDREAIVEAITFGKAATGFIPDAYKGFRKDDLLSTSAKLDEAKSLLNGVSGIDSMNTTIKLVVNNDAQSQAIASLVKTAWESLGHNITVNIEEVGVKKTVVMKNGNELTYRDSEIQYMIKEASEGNYSFDVIGIDLALYSLDPFVGLAGFSSNYGGNGFKFDGAGNAIVRKNIAGWQNDDYDKLIDEAYKAESKTDRQSKLRAAEAKLLEECPIAPIIYNQSFAFIGNKLKNVDIDGFGHFVLTKARLGSYKKFLKEIG